MRAILHIGLLVALAGLAAGCGYWRDDENDILVESENLTPVQNGCVVRGTVLNKGHHTLRVFIVWRAYDRNDDRIGTADVEIRDLPGGERRDYESTRFRDEDGDRPRCDEINRIKRDKTAFRD